MPTDNSITNPVFNRLVNAITPIVSIGVGSAVFAMCTRLGLNPLELEEKDLKLLKPALISHYSQFWADRVESIERQLSMV